MKKKIIVFLSICLVFSCCFIINAVVMANISVDLFNDTYLKGETLTIPETFKVGTTNYSIENVVINSPDGKQYTNDSIILRNMGIYTVEYDAVNGTDRNHLTEQFTSISSLYSISGQGRYEWRANEKTPDTYGINVSLGKGSTFVYNKIIDLNNLAPTDDLVNLYVVPEQIGRPDFQILTITMTDIYDSTNKVMISGQNVRDGYKNGDWQWDYAKYTCYFKGGSTSQPMSGWQRGYQQGTLHVNNTYGYSGQCSFCGLGANNRSMDTDRFTVSFDYREKQVLKDGNIVIDLDDPIDFTELWNGFTTGEVTLSIELSDAGTIVITDIASEKLTSDLVFLDEEPPVISINYDDYEQEIPNAMLGMAYPIFGATAKDTYSGTLDVIKNVYYNYNSASEEKISISGDKFTPTKAGNYTVEYLATDWCGNIGKETYVVEVASSSRPIVTSIVSSTKVTSGFTGDKIQIATIKTSGGYGRLNTITKCYDAANKEVAIKDGSFYALSLGKFKVEYVTTDYIGQSKTLKYEINIELSDKPAIIDDVVIPKYFISGKKYSLPLLSGYVFYQNLSSVVNTEIWVKDSNGERKLDGNLFVPSVTSNGTTIEITYRITANGKTAEKKYTAEGYITTDGNGLIDMKSYFVYGNYVSATATDSYLSYETSLSGEKISFINPLLANGFSLRFNLSEMSKADIITFTLTDYENPNQKVSAIFMKNSDNCTLKLNEKIYDVQNIVFGGADSPYIKFDNVYGKFGISDGEKDVWYKADENMGIYFESGKVYLEIEFTAISGRCALRLLQLNNQNLKYMTVDLLRPSVSVFSDLAGIRYKIGDTAVVSRAVGLDVLDPYTVTTVTVRDADKNVVTDIYGLKLENVPCDVEYRFIINGYGKYNVVYSAKDSTNKSGGYSYVVCAEDSIKPNITLEYRVISNATVGTTIYVPKVVYAEDNVSSNTNIKINYYIMMTDGVLYNFNRELYDSFKANNVGTYIIRYTALDEAGNMMTKDYKITVQ
ncbi:MAG: hypothetical protein J6Y43_00400 [Clostridia bacterium]|nr:hypothetical protein [Clostridia bacterium]